MNASQWKVFFFFIPGSSLNAHEETLSDNHVCQISGGWNSEEAGRE